MSRLQSIKGGPAINLFPGLEADLLVVREYEEIINSKSLEIEIK